VDGRSYRISYVLSCTASWIRSTRRFSEIGFEDDRQPFLRMTIRRPTPVAGRGVPVAGRVGRYAGRVGMLYLEDDQRR
jgi:hypothetical protein